MSDDKNVIKEEKVEDLPGHHLMKEEHAEVNTVFRLLARFVMRSAAWIAIYYLGYFNFSVGWIVTPLVLSVLRDQWKKEKRDKLSYARIAALTSEKSIIESHFRVEDLPSWVFFPDKDRAEWLNSIILQLWPNIGHYTRRLISETIEPSVKMALNNYGLSGFRFERVVLGRIPPRITGIKVYEKNTNRNEVIMDMDLVFASDCEIKFSLKRLKAKINDFSLRGMIRVVFKPLISKMPLIGGVQAYFLTQPEIDFDLGGIANALDAPGLSNIIRKIVLEQIGYFLVLPNKFTMPLTDDVENKVLKCPDSAGILRISILKGAHLMKKDIGVLRKGKSDPYAILTVGAKQVKTSVVNNSTDPEWNFTADFPIEVPKGQELTIEVMDHDDPGDDEFLGRANIQTSIVADQGILPKMWVNLEEVPTGKVLVLCSWLEATSDKSVLTSKSHNDDDDELTKCVLHVFVDSCKGLHALSASAKPSPLCQLTVSQESQSTLPEYLTSEPVFEQGFVFLVKSPNSDDLKIKIIDSHDNKNDVLGYVSIRIADILRRPGLEFKDMPFTLQGSKFDSSITLAARVKCLKQPVSKWERPAPLAAKEPTTEPSPMDPTPVHDIIETAQEIIEEPLQQQMVSKVESMPNEVSYDASTLPRSVRLNSDSSSIDQPILDESRQSLMTSVATDEDLANPGLRHRFSVSKNKCGRIKISMGYSDAKGKLNIFVHEAEGLPGSDLPDPPDPYVKLYLLPDRSKKTKRKSEVIKDTTRPVYNEEFAYEIPPEKLGVYQLEVSVVDKKGIFSKSPLMGRCVIDFMDAKIKSGVTEWYTLEEDDDDSD